MATITLLLTLLFPALIAVGFLGGIAMGLRHMVKRYKTSLKLGIENTYLRLGLDAPQSHDGHLLRSKGEVGGLEGCFVDARYSGHGNTAIDFMIHVPITTLGIPPGVGLKLTKLAHAGGAEGAEGRRVLSTGCAVELEWANQIIAGPIEEVLSVAIPQAHQKIAELDAFYTEPLTAIVIEDGWLVLKRRVTPQAMSSRKAKQGAALELYLTQLIEQTASLARTFSWQWERPEELLEAVFMESSPFTPHREQLMSTLLQRHRGTEAAERVWRYALTRGNLHDVVFAINFDQARALEELTDDRFITFVNTLIESGSFDVSSLPDLAAQRFDFSALLNTQMSWSMRKALLMLWLGTIDPAHVEFNAFVSKLPTTLRPGERRELLGVFMKQPSVVSQSIAPVYTAWVRSDQPLDTSEIQALLGAYIALARALDEDALDDLARESAIEETLIAILERNLATASTAARLLGDFGTAAAIPVLGKAIERSGQTLMGQGAEAKAAREAIVARLRRDPTSGGLSVSREPDIKGGISQAEGEVGGLAIISSDGEAGE